MNLQQKTGMNPMLVFLASFLSFRGIEGNLMGMVGAFIAVAILLGVGTIILGNSTMDCSDLEGFNATGNTPTGDTGWAGTCADANAQAQSAYVLLLIVLIVIAAVVILTVVRML